MGTEAMHVASADSVDQQTLWLLRKFLEKSFDQ